MIYTFSKTDVYGDNTLPLWKWLQEQPKGRGTLGNAIKWNFTKFLIDNEGSLWDQEGPAHLSVELFI